MRIGMMVERTQPPQGASLNNKVKHTARQGSTAVGSRPLIVIVGPTGVGKTEISISLAERLNGEIVSADSRLFYRGMDIGTAKPTPAERRRVPHHLIDIADPDHPLSLAEFQKAATQAIAEIHGRGRLPFLVGGTGQYVRAVIQGWTPPAVAPNLKLRAELERLAGRHGHEWLHAKLATLDPPAAESIDPRNLRRSVRALEVALTTGKRFSDQRSRSNSPYRIIMVGLTRPRQELFARIDARLAAMFEAGFLGEVQRLLEKGYAPSLPSLSAIGYRECCEVIGGRLEIEQARARIQHTTRVFVRRQSNWFKADDPAIRWFDAGETLVSEIEAYLRAALNGEGG